MSTGNWPDGSQGAQEPPKRTSGTKILLIILGIFGGMFLLCCGGLCLGPRLFPKQFESFAKKGMGLSTDPEEIRARTRELISTDLPASFTPVMRMKLPVVNFEVVSYTAGEGRAMVIDMPVPFDDPNAKNLDQQMRQSMQNQGDGEAMHNLDVTSSTSKEMEIRGKTVTVKYVNGTDRKTKAAFKEVAVTFPGKTATSTTALVIQLPEADWDDDEIQGILDSIE